MYILTQIGPSVGFPIHNTTLNLHLLDSEGKITPTLLVL